MKAEIRTIRDDAFLVIIKDEQSLPYLFIPDDFPNDALDEILMAINDKEKRSNRLEIIEALLDD